MVWQVFFRFEYPQIIIIYIICEKTKNIYTEECEAKQYFQSKYIFLNCNLLMLCKYNCVSQVVFVAAALLPVALASVAGGSESEKRQDVNVIDSQISRSSVSDASVSGCVLHYYKNY